MGTENEVNIAPYHCALQLMSSVQNYTGEASKILNCVLTNFLAELDNFMRFFLPFFDNFLWDPLLLVFGEIHLNSVQILSHRKATKISHQPS